MQNYAYANQYLEHKARMEQLLFTAGCRTDSEYRALGEGFALLIHNYHYDGHKTGAPYNLYGSINCIFNAEKQEVYSYKCIDDDGIFQKIITHKNGGKYLIFRRDLYGYSVLNLATLQAFHYFPQRSFTGDETFIWCDVHYNVTNNMLAVTGCYWACPFSVALADFSNPMAETTQICINDFIADGWGIYENLEFADWQNDFLELTAYLADGAESKESLLISYEKYSAWLNG